MNNLKDSTKVVTTTAIIAGNISIVEKDRTIRIDEMKNAIDPSRVLSLNLIAPYFWPIKAAKESEILIISNDVIAISLGNIIIIIDEENRT